nr:nephrocystin-3 [Quercus suber]
MLYSTWQLSFARIEMQSSLAANLLRLWAYFGNRDFWFELLRHTTVNSPEWLQELTVDDLEFNNHVRVLCNHGLVERSTVVDIGSESHGYSVHTCLHAWMQTALNVGWDRGLGDVALRCLASHVPETSSPQWWTTSRRLLSHAKICYRSLGHDLYADHDADWAFHNLGQLYADQGKLDQAEQMYDRALRGKERALGPDHISTLQTISSLGLLYVDQGQLDQAERMYERALRGTERGFGPDHTSTLEMVNNLGPLYAANQGKLDQAEQMYGRTLRGMERALGPDHTSKLQTINNLGLLFADQGELDQAEQMYGRALRGREKALGPDHTSTLGTVNELGKLYKGQGKLDQAERMYERALQGYMIALGPDHISTLDTVNNLGLLYADQGKLGQAEEMYGQALRGREKALGPDHTSTLGTVNELGNLYKGQGKLDKAEQMYDRVLRGYRCLPYTPQARIDALKNALSSLQCRKLDSYSRY